MAYLWYFIYSECLNLENKKLTPAPKKKNNNNNNKKTSLISFENTLLLNMMDYEQIKFYA